MYFRGQLLIDPSLGTEIRRTKPTKGFARMLHWMTAGRSSAKEEQETFTALSILQELNLTLRSLGINNVIRISKDDIDVYYDENGREDDLKDAFDKFKDDVDPIESDVFQTLTLVVEHRDDTLNYLTEFRVHRTHPVGIPPVTAVVNAVATSMRATESEDSTSVRQRMAKTFASQANYEAFVAQHRAAFDTFLGKLDLAIRKHVQVDSIVLESKQKIIRPKAKVETRVQPRGRTSYEPVYYGYYGYDDYLFHAYFWSSMCHDHHIQIHDTAVVDSDGHTMMSVGSEGFDAGGNASMDPGEDFMAPPGQDVQFESGHEFDQDFGDASLSLPDDSSNESSFWSDFGSDNSSGTSSDSFSDSFSSCSSSSCSSGSSCGGCGGE